MRNQKVGIPENVERDPLEGETFGPPTLRGFEVRLDNFEGPFDLLLRLIANREMDLTQVALSEVTDEFLSYVRQNRSLGSATDFLVVAATLLHMKSAALLPKVERDEGPLDEDLEVWDLLFARLLQYQAFKQVAEEFSARWSEHAAAVGRAVPMGPPFDALLSPLKWSVTADDLARLAAASLTAAPRPDLAEHVARHDVSFDDQLEEVRDLIQRERTTTFASLTQDQPSPVVVARFLALLVLYREGLVEFHQERQMGELTILATEAADGRLEA